MCGAPLSGVVWYGTRLWRIALVAHGWFTVRISDPYPAHPFNLVHARTHTHTFLPSLADARM